MNGGTTLGISPGTKFVGFGVLRDGVLIYAQVRSFHGKWTTAKRNNILQAITYALRDHKISAVAVKLPDVLPLSRSFHELIGSTNSLCERSGIKPRYYTLSEIKTKHCGNSKVSSSNLMEFVVKAHPELLLEYRKEKKNRNAYYYKLFEAVSAGMM